MVEPSDLHRKPEYLASAELCDLSSYIKLQLSSCQPVKINISEGLVDPAMKRSALSCRASCAGDKYALNLVRLADHINPDSAVSECCITLSKMLFEHIRG